MLVAGCWPEGRWIPGWDEAEGLGWEWKGEDELWRSARESMGTQGPGKRPRATERRGGGEVIQCAQAVSQWESREGSKRGQEAPGGLGRDPEALRVIPPMGSELLAWGLLASI